MGLFMAFSAMLFQLPLEFEKDDDSNGHIDFITACSVCLLSYSIEEGFHETLKISNKFNYKPHSFLMTLTISLL